MQGIKVTKLRLASHAARDLYGTVLGKEDPISNKLIRMAHTSGSQEARAVHHMGKTTLANMTSGELGVIWEEY